MLDFKQGVKVNGIKPEMIVALIVITNVVPTATITSCTDGKHSINSLHYVGYGLDIRTRNFSSELQLEYVRLLKERLTDEYDVVLESDHIHLEFQPKN